MKHFLLTLALLSIPTAPVGAAGPADARTTFEEFFHPPEEFAGQYGDYAPPLSFYDGTPVKSALDWARRRREILDRWRGILGPWPALLEHPEIEILASVPREDFVQHRVRVAVAPRQMLDGYLLIPEGSGPFQAVVVPYYDPETSVGLKGELRDFARQLTRRGFVTLSIGSPGGDARKPDLAEAHCQPLSYLGYIAANCYNALAIRPDVDPRRIGIVGHSYGGKWALFGACFYDNFACAVWSDPGIVFDESRASINYWEPWYLGLEAGRTRKPGLITPDNPRTGAYARLIQMGRDLHELHALMAPRPFLVSGGAEDCPARWKALNHAVAVNEFLGMQNRVAMTNRPAHAPTAESNEQIYAFFESCLKSPRAEVSVVAHRGLLRDAPEDTLPNFEACLDVHLGFEFDVRRSHDGALVCLHDDTLDRTTDGRGPLADRTLAELQQLDAGGWFAPAFRGTRIPTVDAVLQSIAAHPAAAGWYAVDLKATDEAVETEVVRLARQRGVLDRVLFIGRATDSTEVRRRLRAADARCHAAVVANRREELAIAMRGADSDWVYVRFLPTPEEVAAIRAAGKRTILAGPVVAGLERSNWSQAAAAGVDAMLTDFPLECRRQLAGRTD